MKLHSADVISASMGALPRVGDITMAVTAAGTTTTFHGSKVKNFCTSLKTNHDLFGNSECEDLFDGDTNSVVIFKHYDDENLGEPYVQINGAVATYESVWMYFHPMNHG